jgi:heat shock protein HslJ
MKKTTYLRIIALLLLTSCAAGPAEPSAQIGQGEPTAMLEASSWRILSIDGVVPTRDIEPNLNFSSGRISGSLGCNRLSGNYTQDGPNLRLGQMIMTRMACSGARGTFEDMGLTILNQLLTISFGERMTMKLKTADGRTILLRRLDWD